MQRIIRDYHEQLYANKMDTLEEMGKFLETTFKTEEEKRIENMNRPITSTEIESDLNLLTSKSPRPDVFTGEF